MSEDGLFHRHIERDPHSRRNVLELVTSILVGDGLRCLCRLTVTPTAGVRSAHRTVPPRRGFAPPRRRSRPTVCRRVASAAWPPVALSKSILSKLSPEVSEHEAVLSKDFRQEPFLPDGSHERLDLLSLRCREAQDRPCPSRSLRLTESPGPPVRRDGSRSDGLLFRPQLA